MDAVKNTPPIISTEEKLPGDRAYWPALPDDALQPDYAGVRPKLLLNDEPYTDFLIQDADNHGVEGLINLLGIECPGLTAALALAERTR